MDEDSKEILVILLTIIILGITIAYLNNTTNLIISIIAFFLIIAANILAKKIVAYNLETKITIKPWSIYRYGFRNDAHFNQEGRDHTPPWPEDN